MSMTLLLCPIALVVVAVGAQCPEELKGKAEFNFKTFVQPSIPNIGSETPTVTQCSMNGKVLSLEATFSNTKKCKFSYELNGSNAAQTPRLAYEQGYACKALGMPQSQKASDASECDTTARTKALELITKDAKLTPLNVIDPDIEECWKNSKKINVKFRINNHNFCLGETPTTNFKLTVSSYSCTEEPPMTFHMYMEAQSSMIQQVKEEKPIIYGKSSGCTDDQKETIARELDKSLAILSLNLAKEHVTTCTDHGSINPPSCSFIVTKDSKTIQGKYVKSLSKTPAYIDLSPSKGNFELFDLTVCSSVDKVKALMMKLGTTEVDAFFKAAPKPELKACHESSENLYAVWNAAGKPCYYYYTEKGSGSFFTCETLYL